MDEEWEYPERGSEFRNILSQYEQMIRNQEIRYFDVDEFENIIDYYLETGQVDHAIDASEQGIKQHPGALSLPLKKAQALADRKNHREAMIMLHAIEQRDPENGDIHMIKGSVFCQTGKIKEAVTSFEKALELAGEDQDDVLFEIALSFEYAHHFRIALKYLMRAYHNDRSNFELFYDIANAHEHLHEYNKAIEYYRKYLDYDPFSENVWYNLGMLYYKTNQFEKAIEAFNFAIAINERYASALLKKADTLYMSGEYRHAALSYQDFLAVEPENIIALNHAGNCFLKLGQNEKAKDYFARSIELESGHAEAWVGMGSALKNKGHLDDAIYHYNKAVSLDPENAFYWQALASLHKSAGNFSDARIALRKTVDIDVFDYKSWLELSELELSGSIERAISALLTAFEYNDDVPSISYRLAAYYFLSGRKKSGYRMLEKALRLDPSRREEFYAFYPTGKAKKHIQQLIGKYNNKS